MAEILNGIEVFQNEYGTISLEKVMLIKINKTFNFKDVAYIEIKIRHILLFYRKYYLRVTCTDATTVDFPVMNNEIGKARQFVRVFSNIRAFTTEIN